MLKTIEKPKIVYEKPVVIKERKMNFPLEILCKNGKYIVCKQCSSCHSCR